MFSNIVVEIQGVSRICLLWVLRSDQRGEIKRAVLAALAARKLAVCIKRRAMIIFGQQQLGHFGLRNEILYHISQLHIEISKLSAEHRILIQPWEELLYHLLHFELVLEEDVLLCELEKIILVIADWFLHVKLFVGFLLDLDLLADWLDLWETDFDQGSYWWEKSLSIYLSVKCHLVVYALELLLELQEVDLTLSGRIFGDSVCHLRSIFWTFPSVRCLIIICVAFTELRQAMCAPQLILLGDWDDDYILDCLARHS